VAVLRLSFTNLAAAVATCAAAASAQVEGFCASEAQAPQRPFKTWRTATTTTTAEWLVDLGSSQTLHVVALVNANFTSATIQGASSSGLFAAPGYNEAVVLTRNPLTWRTQHAHVATCFGYRWLRVEIDACSQAGLGVTSTYFSLGGVWAGQLTSAPTHLQVDATFRTILPRLDDAYLGCVVDGRRSAFAPARPADRTTNASTPSPGSKNASPKAPAPPAISGTKPTSTASPTARCVEPSAKSAPKPFATRRYRAPAGCGSCLA